MERRELDISRGLSRPLTVAAGTVLGLLAAYFFAPALGASLVPAELTSLGKNVVWPEERPLFHQFTTYVAALSCALFGAALLAGLGHRAECRRYGGAVLSAVASLVALGLAASVAPFAGLLAALLLFAITALGAPAADPAPLNQPDRAGTAPLFLLAAEAMALVWGVFLVFPEHPRLVAGTGALLLAVLAARLWLARSAAVPKLALRRDAAAGVPFLLLPLLALLRAPRFDWVVLALVASGLLSRFVVRARTPGRTFDVLASGLAAAALAGICFIPAQFRELDSINHAHHEAQHLGWLASALRGKWLMADASLCYGPLREYAMLVWLKLAGVTLEQVRAGAVVLNFVGTFVLCAIGFRLVRGRFGLLLLATFLLLTFSPLRYFAAYKTHTAFGWADVLRMALSLTALSALDLGLCRTATVGHIARRDRLTLGLFGGVNGLAFFYSQEFGLCALAAAPLAFVLDGLARGRPARRRAELSAALRRALAYVLGFLLFFAAWVLVYAAAGKASSLLRSLFLSVALPGSGAFGSLELPIQRETFHSLRGLLAEWTRVPVIEFLLAPLVYALTGAVLVTRAAWGHWDARARFQLGLLLFGAASYRFATARADGYHLSLATPPAVLLLVSLLADALAPGMTRISRTRVPLAAALALLVLYGATKTYGVEKLLAPRLRAVLQGEETPSRGPKYHYARLGRAGDIRIPEATVRAAEYIRAESGPRDFVFSRVNWMDGGELMFLANRVNPTRFDNLAELVWRPQQRELLADLRQNPPELVLGDGFGAPYLDAETLAYLASGWEPAQTFGVVTIMKRKGGRSGAMLAPVPSPPAATSSIR